MYQLIDRKIEKRNPRFMLFTMKDEETTKKVREVVELLEIELLDHIMIGRNGAYYSFVENNRIGGSSDESQSCRLSLCPMMESRIWQDVVLHEFCCSEEMGMRYPIIVKST